MLCFDGEEQLSPLRRKAAEKEHRSHHMLKAEEEHWGHHMLQAEEEHWGHHMPHTSRENNTEVITCYKQLKRGPATDKEQVFADALKAS